MAHPTVGTATGAASTTFISSVSNQGHDGPANSEASANGSAPNGSMANGSMANGSSPNGSVPNGSVAETQVAETSGDPSTPSDITVIHVTPGQPIDLPIDPAQLADAQIQIVGGDLEIKLPDGHIFLLVGFVDADKAGNAPDVVVLGGEHMSPDDVLAL